jgi:hypothetical protein
MDISKIKALVGGLEFDECEVIKLMNVVSKLAQTIDTAVWKGKSGHTIIEEPTLYKVNFYQKQEINPDTKEWVVTPQYREVPKERVRAMWNVIARRPLDKWTKGSTLAGNLMKKVGILDFHRDSGSFDFSKFFGNREHYLNFYYFPIKVLEWHGVISHSKRGKIKRIARNFEVQTKFRK